MENFCGISPYAARMLLGGIGYDPSVVVSIALDHRRINPESIFSVSCSVTAPSVPSVPLLNKSGQVGVPDKSTNAAYV